MSTSSGCAQRWHASPQTSTSLTAHRGAQDEAEVLYVVAVVGLIVPSLAVLVRRLHDTGRSGWWYFISLVPCIGGIWLLVLLVGEGTAGQNQYG